MEIKLLTGERQKKESDKACVACNDYLRMGPGRSLAKLHRRYTETTPTEPPTKTLRTLKTWSTKYGWQDRATTFDARWEEFKTEERRRIFESELALDYERVKKLNHLGQFLEMQMYEQGADGQYHNIWLPDVKIIGSGEFATTVDIERFNQGIIKEFRETLNDLAAETGGRVKRSELSGPDGGDIPLSVTEWRKEYQTRREQAAESSQPLINDNLDT
jgi:hypothetical protein